VRAKLLEQPPAIDDRTAAICAWLASRGRGQTLCEIRVTRLPDGINGRPGGTHYEHYRDRNETDEQGIFNKVLPNLFIPEIAHALCHECLLNH
jgi:hypothetical protein